jgi:phage shock protein PspC (stress-responsive transcriptional regulator)
MSNPDSRRSEWTVLAAVALIVVGCWMLLERVGGPWWSMLNEAFRWAFNLAWPVAIIGLGVLLLVAARRGAFDSGSHVRGRRLYRSRTDRMVGGVLGGLAEYLGWDPTLLRIAYVLLTVVGGFWSGVVVYVIAQIIIPEEPKVTTVSTPAPSVPGPPAPPATPAPPGPSAELTR